MARCTESIRQKPAVLDKRASDVTIFHVVINAFSHAATADYEMRNFSTLEPKVLCTSVGKSGISMSSPQVGSLHLLKIHAGCSSP